MLVIFLDRCKYGGLRVFGLLLLGYFMVGCARPVSSPPKFATPPSGQSAKQRPVRIIIYFQGPTTEGKQLTSAVSSACNCQPAFFRRYLDDALIYEITLPQDEALVAFKKRLMLNATPLGIKAVEEDRVMQYQ